jgi:hypothetical protein
MCHGCYPGGAREDTHDVGKPSLTGIPLVNRDCRCEWRRDYEEKARRFVWAVARPCDRCRERKS